MKKQKILITGGAGYLGGVLTKNLLREGARVMWIDTLRYGQQSPLQFVANPDFTFQYGDVRDIRLMRDSIPKHDVILPLAAMVGAPACALYPEDAVSINRDAIIMLNELRSKEQKLIYPTTNSGYGATDGEMHCTEDSPLNPLSLYGETKAAAESVLLNDNKLCVALRLATVFGMSPRPRLDLLVNDLTYRAYHTKRIALFEKGFMRNFVHINDVARVFIHALDNYDNMSSQKLFNVGHPDLNISKEELVKKISLQIPGLKITEDKERKDPDKRNYIVSSQRLLNTGFRFQHTLEQGISEIINAYSLLSSRAIQSVAYNYRGLP